MILPDRNAERTELLVLYDLRDPEAWERAGSDRGAWGRRFSDVHPMGRDHVLIVFRPGGAAELRAAS